MDGLFENLLGRLHDLEARMTALESAYEGLGVGDAKVSDPSRVPPPIRTPRLAQGDCQYAGGGQWSRHDASRSPSTFPAEGVGNYYLDFRDGVGGRVMHEGETDTLGELVLAFTRDMVSREKECVTQWYHRVGYQMLHTIADDPYRPYEHTEIGNQFENGRPAATFYYHPTFEDGDLIRKSYFRIGGVPGGGVRLSSAYAPWIAQDA